MPFALRQGLGQRREAVSKDCIRGGTALAKRRLRAYTVGCKIRTSEELSQVLVLCSRLPLTTAKLLKSLSRERTSTIVRRIYRENFGYIRSESGVSEGSCGPFSLAGEFNVPQLPRAFATCISSDNEATTTRVVFLFNHQPQNRRQAAKRLTASQLLSPDTC